MSGGLRRFWAKRPLFVIAIVILAVAGIETLLPSSVFAGGIFVCFLIAAICGWRAGLVIAVLALSVVVNLRLREVRQESEEKEFSRLGIMEVEGRLTEDAEGFEGGWSGVVRLRGEGFEGSKVSWIGICAPPPAGTELKASGQFKALEVERNPGTLDRRQRLRNEGVVASFKASEMRSEQWTGKFSERAAVFKQGFRDAVVAGIGSESMEAKVIHAVVLGERARDSLELVRRFRESGTLHVFTVSGLHVAMLGSLVWFVLKWVGVPRRWAIPAIVAAMFGYVWLAGNGPAAIRAAWMGTVVLGAFALRRQADLLNSLGAVLLVTLLIDPRMVSMPGVQLSYGVVAAIGLATPVTRKCFAWIAAEETFLPASEMGWWQRRWLGFRQKLAEGLGVSTAAWLGSAPLTIFHFGLITPVSVVATVVLVAQVYVLLAVALVSAMMLPFWKDGSFFLNRGNAVVAAACANTAGFFAEIPGASTPTRSPGQDTLLIYDLEYGASAACFAPQGGKSVLIDSGGKYNLKREVGPSLQRLGMIPDSVVFTHSDAGHIVEPNFLTEMFPIRQVALGMPPSSGSVAMEWKGFSNGRTRVIRPSSGDNLDFGAGVWAEILISPNDQSVGSVADDRCLVFRMHWDGWTILFMGDAGRLTEVALLESGLSLEADLIVAGMHESDLSLTPDFISAVSPKAIVIPSPVGCEMDSLRKLQTELWRKRGILVFDQSKTGGLTVTKDADGGLVIERFLDGSRTVLIR